MRAILPCLVFSALAMPAIPASATDLGGGLSVSGGAALVSDYRFRGVSLSGKDPAIQGHLDLTHDSGVYVGSWASSIDGGDLYGDVEVDLYAGWSGDLLPGITVDAMIAYYSYPDGNDGFGDADYFEATSKLGRAFGPVEASVGASYSWEQKGLGGGDNLYLFADAEAAIPTTPLTAKAHFGHSDGALAPGGDYRDWSLGVDAGFGPLTVGAAYVDTDLPAAYDVDPTLVFSVGVEF